MKSTIILLTLLSVISAFSDRENPESMNFLMTLKNNITIDHVVKSIGFLKQTIDISSRSIAVLAEKKLTDPSTDNRTYLSNEILNNAENDIFVVAINSVVVSTIFSRLRNGTQILDLSNESLEELSKALVSISTKLEIGNVLGKSVIDSKKPNGTVENSAINQVIEYFDYAITTTSHVLSILSRSQRIEPKPVESNETIIVRSIANLAEIVNHTTGVITIFGEEKIRAWRDVVELSEEEYKQVLDHLKLANENIGAVYDDLESTGLFSIVGESKGELELYNLKYSQEFIQDIEKIVLSKKKSQKWYGLVEIKGSIDSLKDVTSTVLHVIAKLAKANF